MIYILLAAALAGAIFRFIFELGYHQGREEGLQECADACVMYGLIPPGTYIPCDMYTENLRKRMESFVVRKKRPRRNDG